MNRILILFLATIFAATAFGQPFFEKTRTMMVGDLQLYVVSPADIGYPKNVIAARTSDIVEQAAKKGYKPCPGYVTDKLYLTYSDGEVGTDWSAFKWLTIFTSYGNTYRIGKDDTGKFKEEITKDAYYVFLRNSHANLVFIKD